jgi:hypothetical protein
VLYSDVLFNSMTSVFICHSGPSGSVTTDAQLDPTIFVVVAASAPEIDPDRAVLPVAAVLCGFCILSDRRRRGRRQ